LRVFEIRVLRRIFGPKRDEVTGELRRLHKEELYALYSTPDEIKKTEIGRVCSTYRGGEYMVFVEKPTPLGKPRRGWDDNTQVGF
jgi:hypothetical protein